MWSEIYDVEVRGSEVVMVMVVVVVVKEISKKKVKP